MQSRCGYLSPVRREMLTGMNAHTRMLADGAEAPLLALGVWQVPYGPECVNAVRWALEAGSKEEYQCR